MLRLEGGEQVGWVKWTEGMGKSKFVIKEHGEGPFKAFRRTKTLTVFVDKFDRRVGVSSMHMKYCEAPRAK